MDSAQAHRERRVGEQLIEWYNQQHGTSFQYLGRPAGEAPDLEYRDGKQRIGVEVTEDYYDSKDAKCKRGREKDWGITKDFDRNLLKAINESIAAKCRKDYGADCLLAVYVFANLTDVTEMETLLKDITIPATHRFDGIYLCCEFPPPLDVYINGVLKGDRQLRDRMVWPLFEVTGGDGRNKQRMSSGKSNCRSSTPSGNSGS